MAPAAESLSQAADSRPPRPRESVEHLFEAVNGDAAVHECPVDGVIEQSGGRHRGQVDAGPSAGGRLHPLQTAALERFDARVGADFLLAVFTPRPGQTT